MSKFATILAGAALCVVAAWQAPQARAQAAPAQGRVPVKEAAGPTQSLTRFPPTAEVEGSTLLLTGWGTRKRLGFEIYHAALYVQEKSGNPTEYMDLKRRDRVVLHFARELDNEQFTRIMLAALKERVNMKETPTVVDSMQKFAELFSSVPLFKVGDEVTLTILPGGRMEFAINGDTKGFKPIIEPPLARGLLSIFIGPKPVDDDLKRDMLAGGPASSAATQVQFAPRR